MSTLSFQPEAERFYAEGYWRSGDLWADFAARAEAQPGKVALILDDRRVTYDELRRAAIALSARLAAGSVAPGALVAWRVAPDRLDSAFNYMVKEDPFSGHVVIRSTDSETPGSVYRLWTTLKVPQGFSMQRHCEFLAAKVGADAFTAASCLRRSRRCSTSRSCRR